jgi:hypothetical protein
MSHKGTATTFEECCRRASIARHMAGVAICSCTRAYFLELEDQWISQARKLQSRRGPNFPWQATSAGLPMSGPAHSTKAMQW